MGRLVSLKFDEQTCDALFFSLKRMSKASNSIGLPPEAQARQAPSVQIILGF